MRIWLFAAKRGFLVHTKIVLLLSTSMAGSALMAGALQQHPQRTKSEFFVMEFKFRGRFRIMMTSKRKRSINASNGASPESSWHHAESPPESLDAGCRNTSHVVAMQVQHSKTRRCGLSLRVTCAQLGARDAIKILDCKLF